ncbi:VrrA/YqfQ family protein [Solibacillus silvestris]|uniref:VrrA/YqfQ family protein n=1 Tax=Solibacillus silvestris TaxID=76853 RepID=UPI003F804D4F
MRPPYYFPPQALMNRAPVAPRFPMYAPYVMRSPYMNQIPVPPQIPPQAVGGAPKLESFLAGANSLFNNAQKFTPYIQQAAPMFKNLPALWRLYKGFKDTPDDPLESSTVAMPKERPFRARPSRQTEEPVRSATPKPSVPMIFQPPFE